MKNIPKVRFLDVPYPHGVLISTEVSHKAYHRLLAVDECPICKLEKGDKNADKTKLPSRQENKGN